MITNAKDKTLAQSQDLPNMSEVVSSFTQPITFVLITKSTVDGYLQETTHEIETRGMIVPLSPQRISIKPEGQRAWKWDQLFCLTDVSMNIDDQIIYDNEKFRIMSKTDYSKYGFIEYEIVQDYIMSIE